MCDSEGSSALQLIFSILVVAVGETPHDALWLLGKGVGAEMGFSRVGFRSVCRVALEWMSWFMFHWGQSDSGGFVG